MVLLLAPDHPGALALGNNLANANAYAGAGRAADRGV